MNGLFCIYKNVTITGDMTSKAQIEAAATELNNVSEKESQG